MGNALFHATLFVVLLGVSGLVAQEAGQRLRLTHADVLRKDITESGEVRQVLEGNVAFRQGGSEIRCDLATHFPELARAQLVGSVRIYDEEGTLFADTVFIYQKLDKQVAVGNVISISDKDSTFADRMTNWEKEDRILSEGHVKVIRSEKNTVIRSGYLEYFREKEYSLLWENPEFTQFDSLGQVTMHVTADTMKTLIGEDRTIATGNVNIIQKGAAAKCGRAVNVQNEGRVEMYRMPTITKQDRTISGDTLFLYLDNSELRSAEVRGNAVATSEADSTNPGRWIDKLSGNHMMFHFQDEKLQRVEIDKQAVSRYHIIKDDKYEGVSETTGDRIEILFVDGEVQKVLVHSKPGLATGKFTPPS